MGADFSGWGDVEKPRTTSVRGSRLLISPFCAKRLGAPLGRGKGFLFTYLDSSASLTAARVTPARIKKANSTRG